MSAHSSKDDDRVNLSLLTAEKRERQSALTEEDFSAIAARLITDVTASAYSKQTQSINIGSAMIGSGSWSGSGDEFWNELMLHVTNLGFTFEHHYDASASTTTAAAANNQVESGSFDAPYDSEKAKLHLTAASALLGISKYQVKVLTDIVLEKYLASADKTDSSSDYNADLYDELLGTKRLLLLVRDNHYAQQIARIKIVTEAMRLECQEDDVNEGTDTDAREDLQKKCTAFLDIIDERNVWTSSSRDPQLRAHIKQCRGLFRLLVTMACAPVKMLGREEIYQACQLSDRDDASGDFFLGGSRSQDFAKQLMDEHVLHNDSSMRTEALEALFVLLYQRIHEGIDRCDYVLLLHAFGSQDFFADCQHDHIGAAMLSTSGTGPGFEGVNNNLVEAKRRSQLTALILAECMGLWRSRSGSLDMNMTDDDNVVWADDHPFLGYTSRVKDEIDIIGQLLQQFARKVPERRQIQIIQRSQLPSGKPIVRSGGDEDDDDVEAPEAIGLLTFGLLLKLCHNQAIQLRLNTWASDISVKGLAVECVSIANDDCGAFGYLSSVTNFLLASPSPINEFCLIPLRSSSVSEDPAYSSVSSYDFQTIMLRQNLSSSEGSSTQSPLKIKNGKEQESEPEIINDGTATIYAFIAREILVGTLSAFRSSLERKALERDLDPSKVDNLGMFCNLAAKIHRNSSVLCRKFWDDWNSTPQNVDFSDPAALVVSNVDPIAYLFDTAHTVATTAFATLSKTIGTLETNSSMLSTDRGRQESSILPCLSPLFEILSSLIDKHGDAHTILQTCIPRGMVHAALLGCYYLCLEENCAPPSDEEKKREFKRLIDSAAVIIESIRTISGIATKMTNSQSVDWLKGALESESSVMTNLHGPNLLHGIAANARTNALLDNKKAESMTSSVFMIMAFLCQSRTKNSYWAYNVGHIFSSSRDDAFTSFATQTDQVAVAFTFLWRQMTSLISNLAVTRMSEESLLDLMKICERGTMLACDIISATPHTLDPPATHYIILINAISTVQTMLQSVHAIISCCQSTKVVELAKMIRLQQIQSLASSTALGSKIGFLATMLVSKQIANASEVQTTKESMVLKPYFSLEATSEEKKEGPSLSVNFENLALPESIAEDYHYAANLSCGALSLLQTWGEVNESIAIENVGGLLYAGPLVDSIDHFNAEQRQAIGSYLVSFGPCRLLLSSAMTPITPGGVQIRNWPNETFPLLNLLTIYANWGSIQSSTFFRDMATKALDVLSKAVLHCKLDTRHDEVDSQLIPALLLSVDSVGLQLHNALRSLFDKSAPDMNGMELLLQAKILMFLEMCIIYHPLLAKTILDGNSAGKSSLIESMLTSLGLRFPFSASKATIALHCLRVFSQLWYTCRGHYSASGMLQSLTKVHPCDDIIHPLVTSDQLVKNCISIVENLLPAVEEIKIRESITDVEPSMIHQLCVVQEIVQNSLRTIKIDAATHLLKKGLESADASSIAFLKRSSSRRLLQQWLKTVESCSGLALNAEAKELFKQLRNSSNLDMSLSAFFNPSAAMMLTDELPKTDEDSLYRNILYSDATSILLISQTNLNAELSRLGEILYMSLDGETVDGDISLPTQAIQNYSTLAEHAFSAYSCPSHPLPSVLRQRLFSCSGALISLVISSLSQLTEACQTYSAELIKLLEKVLLASNRLIDVLDSNYLSSEGSIKLRLHTISCAILIFDHAGYETEKNRSYEESHFSNDVRLGFCEFACDSISTLRSSASSRLSNETKNLYNEYNGESGETVSHIALLHSSISLLTTVSLAIESGSFEHTSFSSRSFQSELVYVFQRRQALQTLSYHLEQASSASASIYAQENVGSDSEKSFETMRRILALSSILCGSKNMEMIELILDSHFLFSVLKNQILTTACEQWASPKYSSRNGKIFRGYSHSSQHIYDQGSHNYPSEIVADPAHEIWRSTLQVIAALLNSTIQVPSGANARHRSAELAIDFLHSYEKPITSFMQGCLPQEADDRSSSATPTSGFQFTFATINELNDILALISELCSGDHRKQFKSASIRLYQVMTQDAIAIIRTLSSFLGALGVSRELFAALSSLDEIMGKPSSLDAVNVQYQHFASRPLLAEGIPNAKHQAIRNALYASSCCKFITSREESLSKGESKSTHNIREKLEQSFHSHVSNGFILLIESIASQCIYNALSVVHSIHPCSSSFVTFTEQEVAKLGSSPEPPIGAIVAIRSGSDFAARLLPSRVHIRYGVVEYFNPIAKTIDVRFFDNKTEKKISIKNLAALEDVTKRLNLFDYKSAPESVADNVSSFAGNASIGNLILILRWCKQHMTSKSSQAIGVTKCIVTSIAEIASILLGDEIALHMELGSPNLVTEHETPSINRQLLELFDDEETLQNFDLSASFDSQKNPAVLQKGTDEEIWATVQSQLRSSLVAGRNDRDMLRKNSEQAGTNFSALNWSYKTTPTGSRRSPFS